MFIVSPGMCRAKSVFEILSFPMAIFHSGRCFEVSSGTVSPSAMSSHPFSMSATFTRRESPLRFIPWLTRCNFFKRPLIRRSPMRFVVFAFRLLNVSSSTSTRPSTNGINCTLATRRSTSATVSRSACIILRLSICKSSGNESSTRLSVIFIPVLSAMLLATRFTTQF